MPDFPWKYSTANLAPSKALWCSCAWMTITQYRFDAGCITAQPQPLSILAMAESGKHSNKLDSSTQFNQKPQNPTESNNHQLQGWRTQDLCCVFPLAFSLKLVSLGSSFIFVCIFLRWEGNKMSCSLLKTKMKLFTLLSCLSVTRGRDHPNC